MFIKEHYNEYIGILQNHCEIYCDSFTFPSIHPIDLILSKIILDLLSMRTQEDIDEVVNKISQMILRIYENNKISIETIRNRLISKRLIRTESKVKEENFLNNLDSFNDHLNKLLNKGEK
jgi:hypothetical protein